MGIRLTIEGAETISLDEHSIKSYKFLTDTPDDSDARSTDVVNTLELTGKILTAVDGDAADELRGFGNGRSVGGCWRDRGDFFAGWRDRHHEYHAGVRDGAYQRDRYP